MLKTLPSTAGPSGRTKPVSGFVISAVTDTDTAVEEILQRHHDLMRATSPEESCHVMTGAELRASGAHLFRISDAGGRVVGIGALKPLPGDRVELKSMHTLVEARGKGAAGALLTALLDQARCLNAREVLLETGSAQEFAPARRLYQRAGFVDCPPFEDYVNDPLSAFMKKSL